MKMRQAFRLLLVTAGFLLLGAAVAQIPLPRWTEWVVRGVCWVLALAIAWRFAAMEARASARSRRWQALVVCAFLGAIALLTPLGWGTYSVTFVVVLLALVLMREPATRLSERG